MTFEIRPATSSDVDRIMEAEASGIEHPWTRESIEALIEDSDKIALVACSSGSGIIAGYIGASCVLDEAEIGNICVLPSFRGAGAGTQLLASMIKILQGRGISSIFLEVEDSNTAAAHLYEKLGFSPYNTRKNYYGPGKHAVLMRRILSPGSSSPER